jgi:Protoporphyrinogen oxidase
VRARDARGDRVTAAAEKTVPGAPMPGATVAEALAVVVVGGGVGGMAAAYELTREATRCGISLQVTVLEARERVGGSILTETVDGCIVEGGPDCFVSEKPWGIELIEEVGLGEHLSGTNDARRRTYVLWKGRPHPLPDGLILLVPTRILPFVTTDCSAGRANSGWLWILSCRANETGPMRPSATSYGGGWAAKPWTSLANRW